MTRSSKRPYQFLARGLGRDKAIFSFVSAFLRMSQGVYGILGLFFYCFLRTGLWSLYFKVENEARNFASFLGHFEAETRPPRRPPAIHEIRLIFKMLNQHADWKSEHAFRFLIGSNNFPNKTEICCFRGYTIESIRFLPPNALSPLSKTSKMRNPRIIFIWNQTPEKLGAVFYSFLNVRLFFDRLKVHFILRQKKAWHSAEAAPAIIRYYYNSPSGNCKKLLILLWPNKRNSY